MNERRCDRGSIPFRGFDAKFRVFPCALLVVACSAHEVDTSFEPDEAREGRIAQMEQALNLVGPAVPVAEARRLSASSVELAPTSATPAAPEPVTQVPAPAIALPEPIFARRNVFEDPGKFIMIEGSECQTSENGEQISFESVWPLPSYANRGTVVLNGWKLGYLGTDHHVRGMRAEITNAKVTGTPGLRDMVWTARGRLYDKSGSDAFEFCYYYTAFAYSSTWFDATVEGAYDGVSGWDIADGPLVELDADLSENDVDINGAIVPGDSVAVVPRGFASQWDNYTGWRWSPVPHMVWDQAVDHHILQLGVHIGQDDTAADTGGFVRWKTKNLFKDNAGGRKIWASTLSSVIGGESVAVRHGDFNLTPVATSNDCSAPAGERNQRTTLVGLPYDYAIPMLTGWDLQFACNDEHLREVGVWIDDISFASGTLSYRLSSNMRDNNAPPGFRFRPDVAILGLNAFDRPRIEPVDEIFVDL